LLHYSLTRKRIVLSRKIERFTELMNLRQAVRVRPRYFPENHLFGFVVAVSDTFVVLHEIHDFHIDGYLIVPMSNIRGVRSGDSERVLEKVLAAEGAMDSLGLRHQIDLSDWRAMFRSLHRVGKNVIVEIYRIRRQREEEQFIIGRVQGMSDKSLSILGFDALGQWETEPTIVNYQAIKWVQVDSEYINVFSKYVTNPLDEKP
jgi:hypothetical protein